MVVRLVLSELSHPDTLFGPSRATASDRRSPHPRSKAGASRIADAGGQLLRQPPVVRRRDRRRADGRRGRRWDAGCGHGLHACPFHCATGEAGSPGADWRLAQPDAGAVSVHPARRRGVAGVSGCKRRHSPTTGSWSGNGVR